MQSAALTVKDTPRKSFSSDHPVVQSNARLRAGAVLIYFLSFVLVGSAAAKLIPVPKVAAQMAELGFAGGRLVLIAVLEITSALLFAFPRTRSFGLLVVSAYLGGAIATHVGHGQILMLQPEIVLGLIWLAAWLRHPQVFHRAS